MVGRCACPRWQDLWHTLVCPKTASVFGDCGEEEAKWSGGVLAPDGKIYGIPWCASGVLVIYPVAKTASVFVEQFSQINSNFSQINSNFSPKIQLFKNEFKLGANFSNFPQINSNFSPKVQTFHK